MPKPLLSPHGPITPAFASPCHLGQDAESRKQADRWLQHFSTTPGAWEIVNQVLSNPATDPSSPHMMFSVKTLHDKILCDFDELSPETRVGLRDAISAHLMSIGLRAGVPRTVVRRLSCCLAALAVQMQWSDVFAYATQLSSQAPPGQEVNATRLVLELLGALPNQCHDKYLHVRDAEREAFSGLLEGYTSDVLAFLAATGARPEVTGDEEAAVALLRGLGMWHV